MVVAVKTVKVVLLGDSGVGKSSLALRFSSNKFRPYSETTIGASFMSKTVDLILEDDDNDDERPGQQQLQQAKRVSTRRVEFKIWDTAGQEKYHSLAPMYYRGAGAAILVYDLCHRRSFVTLQKWVDEIQEKGPPEIVLVVCGNKSDLAAHRQVQMDEGLAFAHKVNAFYIEVSARDDKNVYDVFAEVARRVNIEDDTDEIQRAEDGRMAEVNLGPSTRIGTKPSCC